MISGNLSLTCVGYDFLVNLRLLIGSSSGFIWVGCDILVYLGVTNNCVVVTKSKMYLTRYIPNLVVGCGVFKERGSEQCYLYIVSL